MKKIIILLTLVCITFFIACDIDIFSPMPRSNPNDPGYDSENDPSNGPDSPPVAPGSVLGVHNFQLTEITLNWTDNSDYETGYVVYRSLSTANDFEKLSVTIAANEQTWTDTNAVTGLEPSTNYKYILKGVNSHGEGPDSNIAEILIAPPSVNIMPEKIYTNTTASFLISFSTVVDGFGDPGDYNTDVSVNNGNGSVTDIEEIDTNRSYRITVTPVTEGSVIIHIPANVATSPSSGGNLQSISQAVIFDNTPPAVASIVLQDNGGYWNQDTIQGVVYFEDNYGIASYKITDSSGPDLNWIILSQGTGTVFTFDLDISSDVSRTVGIQFMDLAGNASTYVYASTTIDTTPPSCNFTLFDTDGSSNNLDGLTNGSGTGTCSADIEISDTGVGASGGNYFFVSDNSTAPIASDPGWILYNPAYNITDYATEAGYPGIAIPNTEVEGNKQIFLWAMDPFGNISFSDDDWIDYDGTAPTCLINNITPAWDATSGVSLDTDFTIKFDEDIVYYSGGSISFNVPADFTLNETNAAISVLANPDEDTVVINPDVPLTAGNYTDMTINGFADAAGNYVTSLVFLVYNPYIGP